jgi:predicted regulator of Ras-like GTPase activity (Roadblock/LC7/MglB family)
MKRFTMGAQLEALLNEMKDKGYGAAVVQVDGVVVYSTIALNELSSSLISSVANVSDAILKRMDDSQKEVEISFGDMILVMIPMKAHIFCGMVKDREAKKIILDYAQKARALV